MIRVHKSGTFTNISVWQIVLPESVIYGGVVHWKNKETDLSGQAFFFQGPTFLSISSREGEIYENFKAVAKVGRSVSKDPKQWTPEIRNYWAAYQQVAK